MNNISQKTLGVLIDELITTNIRCWFAQESVMNEKDSEKIAKAAKLAQETNKRRNQLIRAIDQELQLDPISPSEKSYA